MSDEFKMDRLFKDILDISIITGGKDDDYGDRLSRVRTVVVMIVFAFMISSAQFMGKPMKCWCPSEFKQTHM